MIAHAKHCLLLACLVLIGSAVARADNLVEHPAIEGIIGKLVSEHGYPKQELLQVISEARLQPRVVEAIKQPYEALPWHRYKRLFVTDAHVKDGIEFWKRYRASLERAVRKYGVPEHIIVAIIGVETRYGRNMGRHRVLDSLVTLVVHYPRRREFFSSELEQFLLLTREEGMDPRSIVGSYAGAMGLPQFIASSYRRYAVDFNGDNRRDLITQMEDAIGSVANYLHRHRWQSGKPIVGDAEISKAHVADRYVSDALKTNSTLAKLTKAGIRSGIELNGSSPATLIKLENPDRTDYRIAFENFYVITKYNRSIHYAMAVFELGEELRKKQVSG